jgi:N-sulfoglucosamine sulfohydrolase
MVSFVDLAPTILDFAGAEGPKYPLHGRSFLPLLGQDNADGWDQVFASHTFHEVQMYYPMRALRDDRYKLIFNIAHPLPFPFASDLYESTTWQGVLKRGDERYGPRTVEAYLNRPRFELYDLEADPLEARNLADDPAQADRLAAMKARLRAFQEKTGDPWALKWDRE